jgi:hypothetical protein
MTRQRWLQAAGPLLALLALLLLWGAASEGLRLAREAEADLRTRQAAASVALALGRMLDGSVALARLPGTAERLQRRLQDSPGLLRLCVLQGDQVLHAQPDACPAPGPRVHQVDLMVQGRPVAQVRAERAPQSRPWPGPQLGAALLLAWAAVALATHEALHVAWARGPQRHRQTLADFARQLAGGRFDSLASPVSSLWRDDALLALRAALRDVHEERARVQRLLAALRASETDRARRDAFDALRQAADADERFADGPLAITPAPAAVHAPSARRLAVVAAVVLVLAAAAWLLAAGGGA